MLDCFHVVACNLNEDYIGSHLKITGRLLDIHVMHCYIWKYDVCPYFTLWKVAIGGEASTVREAPASTCETDPYQRLSVAAHHHLPPHSQITAAATSAFHISRPSSSISSAIINLEEHDSFQQVSRLMLQNEFEVIKITLLVRISKRALV